MIKRISVLCLVYLCLAAYPVKGQTVDYSQLDPKPYDPKTDPHIDMFISTWRESVPRQTYGQLIERDIFTPCQGDLIHPATRGAVLEYVRRFTYGTLDRHKSTTPATLKGEQVIFYIVSGQGTIKAGKKTADLHEGVGVLMPEGLEFSMTNTAEDPLAMYIIAEPVPDGFVPSPEMLVKDENTIPVGTTQSHWSHITRPLFYHQKELATLAGMSPVWFDPMTLGQAHSHGKGQEEIWFVLKGDVIVHLGKEIRRLSPGYAYKIPPDGKTPHSNINVSDDQIKLFWFMVNKTQ
ncbi:cupin domain-containing protein [bacterium]|nr:cupin domain-containing protein [bacterium]